MIANTDLCFKVQDTIAAEFFEIYYTTHTFPMGQFAVA